MGDLEFLLRFFRLTDVFKAGVDDFWWRCDKEYAPITIFANCNDTFAYACADSERVTPSNIDVLEEAYADLRVANEEWHKRPASDRTVPPMCFLGPLFAARLRRLRPVTISRESRTERVAALFDAIEPATPAPGKEP